MNNKEIKIVIIILLILVCLYFGLSKITDTEENQEIYLKDYSVNEYIPVYITEDKMAKIYLDDYIYRVVSNPEEAYLLLDEEYRNKKFGSVNNFKQYAETISNTEVVIDKYLVSSSDGYTIFKIYDKNENIYIFKTKGVMQYIVYLDETTVEI